MMPNRHRLPIPEPETPYTPPREKKSIYCSPRKNINTPGRRYTREVEKDKPKPTQEETDIPIDSLNNYFPFNAPQHSIVEMQEQQIMFVRSKLKKAHKMELEIRERMKRVTKLKEKSIEIETEGYYYESMKLWAERLHLMKGIYGISHEKVAKSVVKFVNSCNVYAMSDMTPKFMELLHMAEQHTLQKNYEFDEQLKYRSITLSNISFQHRRHNNLAKALDYAKQAYECEKSYEIHVGPKNYDRSGLADAHLNLGTVLSQLGHHELALAHAKKALNILMEEQTAMEDDIYFVHGKSPRVRPANTEETREAIYNSIIVAHNNIANELEFLSRALEAKEWHIRALSTSEAKLGPHHAMTSKMKKNLAKFLRTWEVPEEKIQSRLNFTNTTIISNTEDLLAEDYISY
jgi:tetratricopeptide (TPR) repeat protein